MLAIKQLVVRPSYIVLCLLVFLNSVFSGISFASGLSDEQRRTYHENINYFDIAQCDTIGPAETDNNIGGSVYMVGDSVTVRAKDDIETAFKAKNTQIYINASVSRSIKNPGEDPKTSGIKAVEDDKDRVKNASIVVIALGTNSDSNFGSAISDIVQEIKGDPHKKGSGINPDANIYWVNVFSEGGKKGYKKIDKKQINGTIDSQANKLNFNVIDTVGKVEISDDSVHETVGKGTKQFANLVSSGVDNNNGGSASGGNSSDQSANNNDNQNGSGVPSSYSFKDKIGQLLFVGVSDDKTAASLEKKYHIGGFLLNQGSSYSKSSIDDITSAGGDVKPFIAADQEGGQVARLSGAIGSYPSAKELGQLSKDQIKQKAADMGQKMSGLGINVNFAPVLDIDNGQNAAISKPDRSFSSNPDVIADKAGAFVEGQNQSGVITTLKHFPGLGNATGPTNGNTDTGPATAPNLSHLESKDLTPYQKILSTDAKTMVMMGNQKVPGLTNGDPASMSKDAYSLLRSKYKFDGVIVTDEIGHAKSINAGVAKAVGDAIQAGADMPLFNADSEAQVSDVIDKVAQNVSKDRVEKSLTRILNLKNGNAAKTEAKQCACSTGTSNATGSNNNEKVFNFLRGKGLSAEDAAAITGNFIVESGKDPIDPNGENPRTHAYGIGQWLGGRLTGLLAYASSHQGQKDDINIQLNYLWDKDIPANEPGFHSLEKLKAANGIAAKAASWEDTFERSGGALIPLRIQKATSILGDYGSNGGSDFSSSDASACSTDSSGQVTGDYAFPVDKKIYDKNPGLFTAPHHDYPADDIGVPSGTKVYSITAGKIIQAPAGGGCGNGVIIDSPDKVRYTYCHGSDGGSISGAKTGDTVKPGQLIMHSDNTGHSTGPHLHVQINFNGLRCPQTFLVSIAKGSPIDPKTLPTSGCTS